MRQFSVRFAVVAVVVFGFAAGQAVAEPCRSESFEGATYTVCSFDPAIDDVRMFWGSGERAPYNTFGALSEALNASGLTLSFGWRWLLWRTGCLRRPGIRRGSWHRHGGKEPEASDSRC